MAPAAGHDGPGLDLPAWSLDRESALAATHRSPFPLQNARDWAWGGATGDGVRVCIIDSGIDGTHPAVGGVQRAVSFELGDDGEPRMADDEEGDLYGHGTACAGIIRAFAPNSFNRKGEHAA